MRLRSGIRGYEGKIKRRLEQGVPIYRTAEESGNSRNRKKILGKSTWFKGGKKNPRQDLKKVRNWKGKKLGTDRSFLWNTPQGGN